jgi:lauroyl/myristoyl acyltransferase
MEINASTVVRFHRLLIRKGREGIYYVTRWGGKSQFATREQGIEAIRALKAGQSVGEVEKALAPSGKTLSINPLLQSLLRADLIRSINGLTVSKAKFAPFTMVKFLFRFHVLPRCLAVVPRWPIPIQRHALYVVTCLGSLRPLKRRAQTAEENIRTTALEVPKSFRNSYLHHLLWNIADTDTVFTSSPSRARHWLDRRVQWAGRENIDRARSLRKGVICAGFHFSASRFVAPLLMSRGLAVNMTATPSPNVDLAKSIRWHDEFCSIDSRGGKFRQIPNVDIASVKELLAALARNEVVLTYPDMHTINPNSDEETRKRCAFFGVVTAGFEPPTITASIGGSDARMNEWAGWLAAQSGAPVLPVVLLRVAVGQFLMCIEPPIMTPIEGTRSELADAINSELFRALDRYIQAHPSQWFGWHRFHFQRVSPDPGRGALLSETYLHSGYTHD